MRSIALSTTERLYQCRDLLGKHDFAGTFSRSRQRDTLWEPLDIYLIHTPDGNIFNCESKEHSGFELQKHFLTLSFSIFSTGIVLDSWRKICILHVIRCY